MTDNDVDDILQKFFVTIAEKDSDAFKLYEDNKRMRNLVEQTLHAREELESRLRSMSVLVNSLQTALREKERLIEAQNGEAAAWREHIAELRTLLDRPSELDHGLEDVVKDVRDMSAELRSLRQGFKYARWCCDEWEEYATEAAACAEARERAVLQEAAFAVLETLCSRASEVQDVRRDAAARLNSAAASVKQWETWYAEEEVKSQQQAETHERAMQRATLETQEQQTRGDALLRELEVVNASLGTQTRCHQQQQQRQWVEAESFSQRTRILEERCRCAEANWASTVTELRAVVQLLAEAQKARDDVTAKHELVLLTHDHERQRLRKLSKQVEQLKQQQSELEEVQQRCSAQQAELHTLREKYRTTADKERSLRQQLHSAAEAAAAKLSAAEDATAAHQRHRYVLEERLRTTQEELKALQRETVALRQQCEEHRATQAVLQATEAQLRETERRSSNFQDALERFTAEQQAQLQAAEARHTEELAALRCRHHEERDDAAARARAAVAEAETMLQHTREDSAKEKAQLQQELREWIQMVESLKKEQTALRDTLEAERAARQLLEQQYQQETTVVRSMMLEQNREEAQRGPQLAGMQSQVSELTQHNELLEEACRRSAGVIAQLREALHREQMTSRSLRHRDASFSS
ncbi:hypothetical protein N2W54_007756 [Lotmaria passim]